MIGDNEKRLEEDPLRILRAIRFATVLNFEIDEKLIRAIKKKKELVKTLSKERVKNELSKILMSTNYKKGLELFKKLAYFQQLDMQRRGKEDPYYQPVIRISIVTARGAPSEERLITTLKSWGMNAAELFLMDGMPKQFVLEQLRPHIFFDDQIQHLQSAAHAVPSVLIPFGVTKESSVRTLLNQEPK